VLHNEFAPNVIDIDSASGGGRGPFSGAPKAAIGSEFQAGSGSGRFRHLKRLHDRAAATSNGTRAKRRARRIINEITSEGWRDANNRALQCLERAWPDTDEKPTHPRFKDAYSISSKDGTQFVAVACVKVALESMDVSVPTAEYVCNLKVEMSKTELRRFFFRTVKQVRLNIMIADINVLQIELPVNSLGSTLIGSNLDYRDEMTLKTRVHSKIDYLVSRLSQLDSIRMMLHQHALTVLYSDLFHGHHIKTVLAAVVYRCSKMAGLSVTQSMIGEALQISVSFRSIQPRIDDILAENCLLSNSNQMVPDMKVLA